MSKPVNKTALGIFVVVALGLAVAAVLILGSGKYFKDRPKFVMYFDGSVKGLQVGAPVVLRGVKVGEVTKIGMLVNEKAFTIRIPVYAEGGEADFEGERTNGGPIRSVKLPAGYMQKLIAKGLRAQLEMQSIVTGQLQIALDFYPDKPARLIGADPRYPEIPTIPTTMQELTARLEKIPVEAIFEKFQSVLDGIQQTANSPEFARLIKSAGDATEGIRKLTEETQNRLSPLSASLTKTSEDAGAVMRRADGAITSFQSAVGEGSPLMYNLSKTLAELDRAARSFRILTDTLETNPETLISGKKETKEGGR